VKILVLGVSGLIGSTIYRVLSAVYSGRVYGASRSERAVEMFSPKIAKNLVFGHNLGNADELAELIGSINAEVLINCVGLTKHIPAGNDPIKALTINALLPHRLENLARMMGARLIHVSTDCVFSGQKGNYSETDQPDATDIYGKTKHLGEVTGKGVVTIRTSTIGHEHLTKHGLLEWFLCQQSCLGFQRAFFSGLPTIELARVIRDYILENKSLTGLYHVGGPPIDKYSLLKMIAKEYGKTTEIQPDDKVFIDRTLNSEAFEKAAGYLSPDWESMIAAMHKNSSEEKSSV
jgi:dTDP-4-dehydrorhamnose reductase